jgi:type IV secretion system protein TrbL
MAPFFRKVLFVGFFAFLVNNWDAVATAINESGAMLGLRAGGSGLTLQDLHNPARMAGLGKDLFGRTIELGEGLNIITDFPTLATIWLAALLVMIAFFVLALQVFVGGSGVAHMKLNRLARPYPVANGHRPGFTIQPDHAGDQKITR